MILISLKSLIKMVFKQRAKGKDNNEESYDEKKIKKKNVIFMEK
jgi:hypothetical protein